MSADALQSQVEKLIGGWVAGTLTPAERAVLLEASLKNQALFDAMADEEGMRELLADPAVRRDLMAVLAAKGNPQVLAAAESWWRPLFKPAPMAAFSAGALAVLAFVMIRPALMEQHQAIALPALMEDKNTAASAAPAKDSGVPPEPEAVAKKSAPFGPAPAPMKARDNQQPTVAGRAEVARRQNEAGPAPNRAADKESVAANLPAPPERKREADEDRKPVPPPAAAAVEAVAVSAVPVLAEPADDTKKDVGKAKLAAAAPAAPALPPLRYRVERQQTGGEWVEFGGELGRGTAARLAIDVTRGGVLTVRSGPDALSLRVAPGETVYFPASGSLPAEVGEREIAVMFRPGEGALADTLSQATQSSQQNYRQLSQTPAGAAGGGRADRQKQAAPQAAAAPSPGEFAVTVRLRYR
jgi:hypothetical protein